MAEGSEGESRAKARLRRKPPVSVHDFNETASPDNTTFSNKLALNIVRGIYCQIARTTTARQRKRKVINTIINVASAMSPA